MVLQLECWPDELSPAQLAAYKRADDEHLEIQTKLDDIVKSCDGEVVFTGENCAAYQVSGGTPSSLQSVAKASAKALKNSQVSTPPTSYVEQPIQRSSSSKRASRAAALAAASAVAALDRDSDSPTPPPSSKKIKQVVTRSGRPCKSTYRSRSPSPPPPPPVSKVTRSKAVVEPSTSKKQHKEAVQSVAATVRPTEATSVGGLATGGVSGKTKNAFVDLTKDDSGRPLPDSREVSFNKLQGKTYPSLVVVARPYLHAKENINADRSALDAKVKSVLMHTPTKFTEWLIQQGLVRSDQICAIHPTNHLKLGMYSDVSKFPYSGGYVWISECCPTRFVSVFSGSLFEGATHPPSVLLKLIYHWSCQTNVQNVVQWVKVCNLYVKGLFTWLRAVCTGALHKHMTMLGGNNQRIEVGVISLGTTSQDGNQRQVKVEVLGVLDPVAKLVRLRAVEPLADGERNYKKRFAKILEPLANWVHKDSVILTDLTVDKTTLLNMGYKTVHQVAVTDVNNKNSNNGIMEYLRRIVPRMFQNTLSLLSRQIIQQFLDELVWREWYGNTPGLAFDNIVNHIAEQTKYDVKETLTARLTKVSANPFKNWAPPKTIAKEPVLPSKRGRKRTIPIESTPIPPPVVKKPKEEPKKAVIEKIETRKAVVESKKIVVESKKPVVEYKKAVVELKKTVSEPKKENRKIPPIQLKKSKRIEISQANEKSLSQAVDKKIDVPKKAKDDKDVVAIESYYYGYLEGDTIEIKTELDIECCECPEVFTNNIKLLNHLLSHVNPVSDKESKLCQYCLEIIPTEDELRRHIIQAHPNDTKNTMVNTLACVMCETRYTTVGLLAAHMSKTHVAFEMPYMCNACNHRCSSHRVAIEHFYENHDGDTTLQCPFCLQAMIIWDNGKPRVQTLKDFYEHLKNHLDRVEAKKCNKCALWFFDKGALKEHTLYAHKSQKPLSQHIKNNCISSTMVNRPKIKTTPQKDSHAHTVIDNYDKLTMYIGGGFNCIECISDFGDRKHFLGKLKCNKCQYITSCYKAMLKHTATCVGYTSALLIPVEPMATERHCICGFSSTDGNVLAKHLVICDRKSAYLSAEDATSNKVVRSMLDMLGLMRRNQDNEEDSGSHTENQTEEEVTKSEKVENDPKQDEDYSKESSSVDQGEQTSKSQDQLDKSCEDTDIPDDSTRDDNIPDDSTRDDNIPEDSIRDDNIRDDSTRDDNIPDDSTRDDNIPEDSIRDDNITDDNNQNDNIADDNIADDNTADDSIADDSTAYDNPSYDNTAYESPHDNPDVNNPDDNMDGNNPDVEIDNEHSQSNLDAPVIDTGLSLDDLAAPPSVLPAPLGQGELDIKDDYQSLATPQVTTMESNMDSNDFEPLPSEHGFESL